MAEAREGERVREDTSARWIGWIGIVAGIMAFFFVPLLFGGAAVVLGVDYVFSQANTLGWWSAALGIVAMIANWWLY